MSGTSTAPISTKNAILTYCATSGGSFVPLTAHEFTVPKWERHEILVTDLASQMELPLAGGGLDKYGTYDFSIYHSEVMLTTLVGLYGSIGSASDGLGYFWKHTFNDGSGFAFRGYVSALECAGKPNEAVVYKVKITLTAAPTEIVGTL